LQYFKFIRSAGFINKKSFIILIYSYLAKAFLNLIKSKTSDYSVKSIILIVCDDSIGMQ